MAKRKPTSFAQVLLLLNTLTDGEKATLYDLLRPAPAPRGKKAATTKRKQPHAPSLPLTNAEPHPASGDSDPEPDGVTKAEMCAACGNEAGYQDHFEPSPNFHTFESSKGAKKKAA